MQWIQKNFEQLTTAELYLILKLRCEVFVVEQNCPYNDLDDHDRHPNAIHLFALKNNALCGYLRILPAGCSYPNMPSFGRVVTAKSARGTGMGRALVSRANQILDENWPQSTCHISAQAYLERFYQQHGFHVVGEPYLEDGIPHIGMERLLNRT